MGVVCGKVNFWDAGELVDDRDLVLRERVEAVGVLGYSLALLPLREGGEAVERAAADASAAITDGIMAAGVTVSESAVRCWFGEDRWHGELSFRCSGVGACVYCILVVIVVCSGCVMSRTGSASGPNLMYWTFAIGTRWVLAFQRATMTVLPTCLTVQSVIGLGLPVR